jgi:hypothetical protein
MTHNEMLAELGLTNEEFTDLLQKLDTFHKSLTKAQRAVIVRSLPTAAAAAATFGHSVTAEQLQKLIATDLANSPIASGEVAFLAPHRPK